MKGTIHEIYTDSITGKGVALSNQQDPYYECLFETKEEVDEFIAKFKKARDEVFGKEEKEK